jgi:hypothetical protein
MSTAEGHLAIADFLRRARREHGQAVAYARVWRALCEGAVEAEKVRGRWMIRERDVPVLAAALGLTRTGEGER